MSKYSLVKLVENELEDGGISKTLIKRNVKLIPKGTTTTTAIQAALENPSNYGIYIDNLRNTNNYIKKEFEKHFGTPIQRRTLTRGGKVTSTAKFAPYTKEEGMKFIADLLKNDENLKRLTPTLLGKIINWKLNNNEFTLTPDKDTNQKALVDKVNIILQKAGFQEKQDYIINIG
jgi:hypothetical protein